MDRIFQIGDFTFRLICPEGVTPPENFMLFAQEADSGTCHAPEDGVAAGHDGTENIYSYTYNIEITERLPDPAGTCVAKRLDLAVYRQGEYESRLIGVKGMDGYYACYREVSPDRAEIALAGDRISGLHIDPVFSSLFAFERRMVQRDSMILHCAYVEYEGEAILFSAPSETGKTTQANLWEKYRGSRTVNGDRALLGRETSDTQHTGTLRARAQSFEMQPADTTHTCAQPAGVRLDGVQTDEKQEQGRWMARGWPVCGTSEVCHNESLPIRAVVMLSQAKENHAERQTPGKAFPLLYSQITVNKWNMKDHVHTLDLIEEFLGSVPVIHLGCTISEEAVDCLDRAIQNVNA